MSGRVTSIDVDLSDPDIIYAGTASGGVWKSTNGGINWKSIFDKQPVQSIGAVAVYQHNPSIIWVGTGEGNPRNSHNSGGGVYKSLDGGKTWTCMGLKETKNIHRLIIHRDNPDIVYVGAMGSVWGPNEERGVYRTRDGGETWEKILYNNHEAGIGDLVVDPTNPNKLIAAMWEYGRKPWTFNSGGPGSGLYVTYDGGDTWTKRTDEDGLPKGELGRIGLAIAPSKPNIVYALVEAKENALYKSTDGGEKWTKVADKNIGNRPFYYADIYVDSKNENRIYNLFSVVSRSEDGGKTFETILPYSGVHPDHHAFWIHPDDPNYLIDGNDGGLNISRDGGDNWRFATNLPLAQFYHINYDMDIPYNVAGGMQDNGSWVGPSTTWKSGGITNADWQEVYFGDGFDVVFDPANNRYVYAMSQGGNVGRVDRTTGKSTYIRPVHPEGVTLRFNWNAAIAQDPFDAGTIYYGSQFVHKSTDRGQSWTIISPDLTTNDPSKQQQDKSGGLTIDDTEAENHTTILAIAPSSLDKQTIWIGTDDGNLQLTRDGGQTWTNLADRLTGATKGSWIPYIELSAKNAGEAFIIVNDYRRNDWRPMVYHTTNYGQTFRRIADEKKVSGHAMSIVQDPLESKHLWLGTDHGLYFSIDGGDNWNKWMNDYPSVTTADLKIHPREQDLIVGTFGRAAWILDDLRPFREMARTGGNVLEQDFKVFTAPDAYLAESRSYQGIRFAADAEYEGTKRPSGALLTLWVKPKKKEKGEAKEEKKEGTTDPVDAKKEKGKKKDTDKVRVQVVDSKGDTIRTFTTKLEEGMNRITWNLNRDGVAFPSRRERKDDDDPPNGRDVLPGVYQLVFTYGEFTDATKVTVHPDPRLPQTTAALQAKEAAYETFYDIVKKAEQAFTSLQEARKSISRVNGTLVNAPDSLQKQIKELGKAMEDSIAVLEKRYMLPDDLKGIQRSSDNINGTLYRTSVYLRSYEGTHSQSLEIMMNKAREETKMALEKINDFFATNFANYQKRVEEVPRSLFKTYEPVDLD
ncbi:MAG: hypothetical protein DHS20C18_40420 [Saprospiraceae bacterium]|nr:MAG: hypothetical protein DHS20C18_40420 [Saprospiraceae bacterium]